MIGDTPGEDLVDLMAKPQPALEKALVNATKKGLISVWSNFKRLLATASDPFFRKEMGERYYNPESLVNGCIVWGLATVLSTLTHLLSPFQRSEDVAAIIAMGGIFSGVGLCALCFVWGFESINQAFYYRVAPVRLCDGFSARRLGSATTKRSGVSNEIEPVILVGY